MAEPPGKDIAKVESCFSTASALHAGQRTASAKARTYASNFAAQARHSYS